jgi:hypothetical protein
VCPSEIQVTPLKFDEPSAFSSGVPSRKIDCPVRPPENSPSPSASRIFAFATDWRSSGCSVGVREDEEPPFAPEFSYLPYCAHKKTARRRLLN